MSLWEGLSARKARSQGLGAPRERTVEGNRERGLLLTWSTSPVFQSAEGSTVMRDDSVPVVGPVPEGTSIHNTSTLFFLTQLNSS